MEKIFAVLAVMAAIAIMCTPAEAFESNGKYFKFEFSNRREHGFDQSEAREMVDAIDNVFSRALPKQPKEYLIYIDRHHGKYTTMALFSNRYEMLAYGTSYRDTDPKTHFDQALIDLVDDFRIRHLKESYPEARLQLQ